MKKFLNFFLFVIALQTLHVDLLGSEPVAKSCVKKSDLFSIVFINTLCLLELCCNKGPKTILDKTFISSVVFMDIAFFAYILMKFKNRQKNGSKIKTNLVAIS